MKTLIKLALITFLSVFVISCFESKTENKIEDIGEKIEETTEDAADNIEDAAGNLDN